MELHSKKSIISIKAVLLIFVYFGCPVSSVCCRGYREIQEPLQWQCDDGTMGTPCCGYGACNIFCCNCDDGCRVWSNGPPGLGSSLEKEVFVKMDRNADGFVDKEEARSYVVTEFYGNHTEKMVDFEDGFKKLDKLGKGRLSFSDIDGLRKENKTIN